MRGVCVRVRVRVRYQVKGKLDVGLWLFLRAQNLKICVEAFDFKIEWRFKRVNVLVNSFALLLSKYIVLFGLHIRFIYLLIF